MKVLTESSSFDKGLNNKGCNISIASSSCLQEKNIPTSNDMRKFVAKRENLKKDEDSSSLAAKQIITIGVHFSGCGSVEESIRQLKQEGLLENVVFKVLYAIEWDPQVRSVYEDNYDLDPQHFYTDIRDVDPTKLPKVDIIVTSSPCVSVSSQGLKKGFNDPRGTLIFDSIKIINHQKVAFVLVENVTGLVNNDGGATFKTIKKSFSQIGYKNNWKILNSLDFNLPQARRRIYGILSRDDYDIVEFPKGERTTKSINDFLEDPDQVDSSYLLNQKYVAENPKYNPKSKGLLKATQTHIYLKGTYESDVRIQCSSSYCGTFTTSISNQKVFIKGQGIARNLTARERMRLQGFGDDFILPRKKDGTLHKTLCAKISGNTIAVTVMKALLLQIKSAFENIGALNNEAYINSDEKIS